MNSVLFEEILPIFKKQCGGYLTNWSNYVNGSITWVNTLEILDGSPWKLYFGKDTSISIFLNSIEQFNGLYYAESCWLSLPTLTYWFSPSDRNHCYLPFSAHRFIKPLLFLMVSFTDKQHNASGLQLCWKRGSGTDVFLWILRNF